MKTHEIYVKELAEKNPGIECLGTYTRATDKTLHRCRACGHEWMVRPYTLVSKKRGGCPHCAAVKAGKANKSYTTETFVEALGKAHEEIVLVGQYPGSHVKASFSCLRCGHEWQARPYSVLQGHGCPRCAKLWRVVDELLVIAGHPREFTKEDREDIETKAYEESKSLTHEVFLGRMAERHPSIEVLGKYVNSNRRVRCRCKVCGWEWDAVPASLMSGDGCRKCGAKGRGEAAMLPVEEFVRRLRETDPTIEIDPETYRGTHEPVRARCLRCGKVWEPTARTLIRKNPCGCSDCRKRERIERLDAKYRTELRAKKPQVTCLDSYVTRETKIRHRCEVCGFIWESTPATVLRSVHGCPNWSNHDKAGRA